MSTEIDLDILPDDIPGQYREVAEILGLDAALRLARECGGESIYIPKIENIFRNARDRAIRAEFNGSNFRELAKKYKLSVNWVRQIVADCRRQPVYEQSRLF